MKTASILRTSRTETENYSTIFRTFLLFLPPCFCYREEIFGIFKSLLFSASFASPPNRTYTSIESTPEPRSQRTKSGLQHAELGAYLAPRMMMAGRDNRMGEKLFFIMLYFSIIMLHLSVVVVFHPLCHSLAHSKFMAMARSPRCFILFYDFI